MKKLIYILAIISVFTGCKTIECRYHAKRAVKLQERSVEHIDKMLTKGCDFDIDSVLKARTISVLRDTIVDVREKEIVVEVPSDKLVFEQRLMCDSLGRVVLDLERRIKRKPKFIKGKVIVKDNVIRVECSLDSAKHQIAVRDTTIIQLNNEIESLKQKSVTLKEQPKQSWGNSIKGILIWIFLILIVLGIGWILNKTVFKE